MRFRFANRAEAGRFLAGKLETYASHPEAMIFGLPRGGIVVASAVAHKLHLPSHAFLVRKLGVPGQEELAMGAIAGGGICFLNHSLIRALGIPQQAIDAVMAREKTELARRQRIFNIGPPPEIRGKTIILIDDGLATGASMRAAVTAARGHHPARMVVAVPVAAESVCREFAEEVDEFVCVHAPEHLEGVGQWYEDFEQTSDEEVRKLLEQSWAVVPSSHNK